MTVILCSQLDVERRLRRTLTGAEEDYLLGMIEEAQLLVLSYLDCPAGKFAEGVPDAIKIVTSRIVARVIQEGESVPPDQFGATQVGLTAGPFSQQTSFQAGSRTGAPWLTKADKDALAPYRCAGKAFAIDTAPTGRHWPSWLVNAPAGGDET